MRKKRKGEEVAWAAGLFEGEGCIHLMKRSSKNGKAALTLSMADQDVVHRFSRILGVGNLRGPYTQAPGSHWKPMWTWEAGKRREVQSVLNRVLPFLGERRLAKAREVLIWYATHQRYGRRRG
jgi:hypothetical protein